MSDSRGVQEGAASEAEGGQSREGESKGRCQEVGTSPSFWPDHGLEGWPEIFETRSGGKKECCEGATPLGLVTW